jgi:predicted DNA-binding transcriptional regulator AlpA
MSEAANTASEDLTATPTGVSAMTEGVALRRYGFQLVSTEELCDMLGVTPNTLAAWRREARGPDYVKLGSNIYYRHDDIKAWIAANVTVVKRAS